MSVLLLLLLLATGPAAGDPHDPSGGAAGDGSGHPPLLGQPAPGWDDPLWVQGGPLAYDSLRGRVLLVRWWTGPGCPYCRASAPSLQRWNERFGDRGLTVVGLYHHKAPGRPTTEEVSDLAAGLGFTFPIAIDGGWRTLERWWPADRGRTFTSVSFLVDRDGIVRYVHPGGAYDRSETAEIEGKIIELLESPRDR